MQLQMMAMGGVRIPTILYGMSVGTKYTIRYSLGGLICSGALSDTISFFLSSFPSIVEW
jgi:hypothetical protein